MMKRCGICGKEFKADRNKKYCSPGCSALAHKQSAKEWYEANAERIREKGKAYRKKNEKKIKAYAKAYYWDHREEKLEQVKQWKLEHRDYINEYSRNYYNRQKIEQCQNQHNGCFDCPTEDGECLFN